MQIEYIRQATAPTNVLTWVCVLFVRVEVYRVGDGEHEVPGPQHRPRPRPGRGLVRCLRCISAWLTARRLNRH